MSFNIEHVYTTDGSDISTTQLSTSVASVNSMLFDGKYLWVMGINGIAIFSYFGSYCYDEPSWAELDDAIYQNLGYGLSKKLRLVTYIKVTSAVVVRTTVDPALSLFPTLSSSDADGTYVIGGVNVVVKTLENGERAITTSITRTGSDLNTLNAFYGAIDGTKLYATNGNVFSEVFRFNVTTQDFETAFRITPMTGSGAYPTMTSNMIAADGKLWTVTTMTSPDLPQTLQSYNLSTGVTVQTTIPVRPGTARSWIADGYNSHVYVTNYNNLSVTRFTYSNVLGAVIRVNSSPSRIFSFPDKKIYVSSYAGMLSLIDWDDDGVHNDWGTESTCLALYQDPTDSSKVWFLNDGGTIANHDLNTHDQTEFAALTETDDWISNSASFAARPASVSWVSGIYVGYQFTATLNATVTLPNQKLISREAWNGTQTYNPDIVIRNTSNVRLVEYLDYTLDKTAGTITFLPTSTVVTSGTPVTLRVVYTYQDNNFLPTQMLVTPSTTYTSGGTINVDPYIFFFSGYILHAARLDTYFLNRPAKTGVTGQGAVVAGSNQYFGD